MSDSEQFSLNSGTKKDNSSSQEKGAGSPSSNNFVVRGLSPGDLQYLFNHDNLQVNTQSNEDTVVPSHTIITPKKSPKFNLPVLEPFPAIKSIDFDPNADNLKSVGLCVLPNQSEKHAKLNGVNFNIMVAGGSGLGKSSFINTLLGTDLLKVNGYKISEERIEVTKANLTEDSFPLNLNIMETSGYGMNINDQGSWLPVLEFVEDQLRKYFFQDQQPDRSKKTDTRIHVCIYFLPLSISSISPLDLETLKGLCKIVNVIPVVSKSDCLSDDELDIYRQESRNLFLQHGIKFCDSITDEEVYHIVSDHHPFFHISCDGSETGFKEKIREYPWGAINIEDNTICDFSLIRQLIMSDYMLEFILSTESHYLQFRERFLTEISNIHLNVNFLDENDGTKQLIKYNKFKFDDLKKALKEDDIVFKHKEAALKAKFNVEIEKQEKRFRSWKKSLVDKQDELNNDVHKIHDELIALQDQVLQLEGEDGEVLVEKHQTIDFESPETLRKSTMFSQFSFN